MNDIDVLLKTLENLKYHDKVEGTSIASLKKKIQRNNKSGITGVSYQEKSGKWRAYIRIKYKHIHLGYFKSKEEAVKARKQAEKLIFRPIIEKYEGNEDTQY